jgi:hypothetical protein
MNVTPGSVAIAVRPWLTTSSRPFVGRRKRAAVRALPAATSVAAGKVPSSRETSTTFPPASTTAIAPPAPSAFAFASAAATSRRAPSSVRLRDGAVCASTRALVAASATNTSPRADLSMASSRVRGPSGTPPSLQLSLPPPRAFLR